MNCEALTVKKNQCKNEAEPNSRTCKLPTHKMQEVTWSEEQTMETPVNSPIEGQPVIPFTNTPQTVVNLPNRTFTDSSERVYVCDRTNGCGAKITGAATLALHLSSRHSVLTYRQYLERTFLHIWNSFITTKPETNNANGTCPIENCAHQISDCPVLIDMHVLHMHPLTPQAFEALARNKSLFEQAYRDARGWTEQDQQRQQTPVTNGAF